MHQKLAGLSVSLSTALLIGCGGGGGSSSADTPPSSVGSTLQVTTATTASAYVPYLNTVTIPTSTYPAGSAELGGWSVLQQARIACGFGQLKQNTLLDAAAKWHAKYQISQSLATGTALLTHYETVTTDPYYKGYYPWDRTQAQGYGNQVSEILEATTWSYDTGNPPIIPTLEQRGAASMRDLLNTVYHMTGAMYKGAEVGFGADLDTKVTGTSAREQYRFGSLNGFQTQTVSIGAGQLATYPCDGSSTVPSYFTPANEAPNPFPAMTSSSQKVGPPIYLKVDATQILTLSTASIVAADKSSVPYTTLTSATDPATEISYNEAFIIPNAALTPNSSYQVNVTGSIKQASPPHNLVNTFNRSFTLKTGN